MITLNNAIIIIAHDFTGPSHAVNNISVALFSSTSAQLSWTPPQHSYWNGIITNYTIICHSLGPNDMSFIDDLGLQLMNTTLYYFFVTLFPEVGHEMANNPDPRQDVVEPIVPERAVITGLQEDFSYTFDVYMSNIAGDSDLASSDTIALPGRGELP